MDELTHRNGDVKLPQVDVVIPCYKYGRYLESCIKSVLAQPGVRARCLVIDDCSPDDSVAIAQTLAAKDVRVTVKDHPVNRGHIATFNEGLFELATSEYVVLLSADDMLAPGALLRATTIMERDPRVGMVYGRPICFQDEDSLTHAKARPLAYKIWKGEEWIARRCAAGHNVISSPEVVVRGSVQRSVGPYRTELPHTGDLEMWMRIASVSDIAYVSSQPQAYYRVHASSMMRTTYASKISDLKHRYAAFQSFFDHAEGAVAGWVPKWRQMSSAALAREALWEACRAYDRNEVLESHAADLEAFANSIWSGPMSEKSALVRRQRLGPALCNKTQLFVFAAALRAVQNIVKLERWKRSGI